MHVTTKLYFMDDDGEKFFGEGPSRLLHAVEQTGSLRAAALSMGMAYTKALKLVNNAERALGYPVITRATGGKSGGGSYLTPQGKAWLTRYDAYQSACKQANAELFTRFFPQEQPEAPAPQDPLDACGCVIMASGMGKRFGGNKLMADFGGEPMIQCALRATQSLHAHRVVVTRHKDVEALCRAQGVPCVLHDLPHRNDTIRLGLEALGDVRACLFCPGDQPLLTKETVDALARRAADAPDFIWRAAHEQTQGLPAVFPAWAFPALRALPEGAGGGHLMRQHPQRVRTLPVLHAGELMDADTPEALEQLLDMRKNLP